jgi:uncharacterized protein (TIGR03435 family)
MTPAIKGMLLAISSSLAASIVAKVTVITALGLFAAWLARGSRAAVRHALLAAALGVTLLLPIASLLVPPVQLGVPVAVENRASAAPPLVSGVDQMPPVLVTDDLDARVISPLQSSRISLSHLLVAGWIAGGAIFLLPVVIGLWQIRLLRRSGLPWCRGQALAQAIALDAGVLRRVEVLLHEGVPGPMTCGIVHPAIVLPPDAESWSEEDLNRAFVHELEHVRRGDSVSRSLARGACAVYWFHPLVWIAWRRLGLEAERSCDDAVLRRSEATAYAAQLVGLAKRLSAAEKSPLLAMANRADLTTRVRAVLDGRQRRGRAGAFSLGLATTAAMVLVISMSSLILVAMPQATQTQTVTSRQFDAVPVKPIGPKGQGEPREKPDPVRLVAQAQRATVDRTVSAVPVAPKFEAVSIHRCDNNAGLRSGSARAMPGRVTAECATLGGPFPGLISESYGMFAEGRRHSPTLSPPVEGGPSWVNSERYTIIAKAEGDPGEGLMIGPMLQGALEDRFKLKLHHETREIPVYALTISKNGSKLRVAEGPACVPVAGKPCLSGLHVQGHNFVLNLRGTLAQFAEILDVSLDQPIVDKTGLSGNFDLHLEFGIDHATAPAFQAFAKIALPNGLVSRADPSGGVSIFTAIQEQLGLKLEPARGPGDFIVIDQVERPSEN